MEIKTIIEKAIQGGYLKKKNPKLFGGFEILNDEKTSDWVIGWKNEKENYNDSLSISELVLDPKFWEAVEKVEEWSKTRLVERANEREAFEYGCKKEKMHEMIDFLCEGGNIEDYIKTL